MILGISLFFNLFNQNIYDQYFEIYPNVYEPIVRNSSENPEKAFVYYENQNYEKAQSAFKSLIQINENSNIRFYFALSYLNNNQPEKAILEFKKIKNSNFDFRAELLWYQALANIKLNNYAEAQTLLSQLISDYPNYKTQETKNLLEEF